MQTLTEQIFHLAPPGGLFDQTVVRNLFSDLSQGGRNILIHRAVRSGEVFRLKRGLYVLSEPFRKTSPHPFAVAAMLYGPSTISLESALSFHGLIPEAVYQTTSVTMRRSHETSTALGDFTFSRVPSSHSLAGVESIKLDAIFWGFVATPFKAIADLVYLRKEVNWSADGILFLTDSMRMDWDELRSIPMARADEIIDSIRDRRTRDFMSQLKKEILT